MQNMPASLRKGMYKGFGPERGNNIPAEEAFPYAAARCLDGDEEERQGFMDIAHDADNMEEFAQALVEWFFSGNWVFEEEEVCNEYAV